MSYYGYWKPYVSVAQRRAQAAKTLTQAKKAGQEMHPINIVGRTIARTFWGKAWCDNLEAYSDFANRLPRGRTYVRNGSVIDLKIVPGKVHALVMGSSLYQVDISIAPVPQDQWKSLVQECTGSIASLIELLQGKLSKAVMERICQPKTGLFPAPGDILLDCSCPDWATMCKHVAAVLYGVGARLDEKPELLFTLRQVEASDLVTQASELSVSTRKTPTRSKVLDEAQLADVFGIEMDVPESTPKARKKAETRPALPTPAAKTAKAKTAKTSDAPPRKKTTVATPKTPVNTAVKPKTAKAKSVKPDAPQTAKKTSPAKAKTKPQSASNTTSTGAVKKVAKANPAKAQKTAKKTT